jgi:hypothetical protein
MTQVGSLSEVVCTLHLVFSFSLVRAFQQSNSVLPQIKIRYDHPCAILLAHRSLPAQMAMQIKFKAQIMNQI